MIHHEWPHIRLCFNNFADGFTCSVTGFYINSYQWRVFIGVGFVFRKTKTKTIALIGISFCYLIELSQLYQANWINEIRRTTLGGLVLGYGFLWSDLVAYFIGISVGAAIEILWIVIQKGKKTRPQEGLWIKNY